VQPSIEATERWDPARAAAILEKLEALTRSAEAKGVDLTVWPEAAYPYEIGHASHRAPIGTWALLGPGVHGPLLVGTLTRGPDEEGGACNSAVVVERDGTLSQPYDKMHLLWFGEEVPFAEEIPWLRRTFARGGGLRPGHEEVPLPAGPVRAAVLNCFEDTLPAAGREAASVEPNLLVNVTNDAWFAGSWESELHLRMAVMRSVELRRDMVRAVNGGRTSFVDATGRVRSRWEPDLPGTLLAEPALLTSPTTLFARYGDAPWLLALSAFLVVLLRRQNAKGAGSIDPTPSDETR